MRSKSAQSPPAPCLFLAPSCAQVCVWRVGRNSCKGELLPVTGAGWVFPHSKGGIAKSTNPSRVYSEAAMGMAKLGSRKGSCGLGRIGIGGGVQVAMVTAPLL